MDKIQQSIATRPSMPSPAAPSTPAARPEIPADLVVLREVVLNNADAWSKVSLPGAKCVGSYGDTPFALTISSSGQPLTPLYVQGQVGDRTLEVKVDNRSSADQRSYQLQGKAITADGKSQDVRGAWGMNTRTMQQETASTFVNRCSVGNRELSGEGWAQRPECAIKDLYKNLETLDWGQVVQHWLQQGVRYVSREQGELKTPEQATPFSVLTALNYTDLPEPTPMRILEHGHVGQAQFDNSLNSHDGQPGGYEGAAFGHSLTFTIDSNTQSQTCHP